MLALGRCVPWHGIDYNEDFVDYDDDDSGGHEDKIENQDKNFKKVHNLQNYLLARILTDRAYATVVTEIHSWIEYFHHWKNNDDDEMD